MPRKSPSVKVGVTQYLGVVVIPKQLHNFHPSWRALLAYYATAYYAHNGTRSTENMTVRSLARVAAVSEDTMRRGLAELVRKGALAVTHRSKQSAQGKKIPIANLYRCQILKESADPL